MSDDMRLDGSNPTESPTENTSQESAPDEWRSLNGRSQDRVKKIISEKNYALDRARELEQEVERLRQQTSYQHVPMPQVSQSDIPYEERLAMERLKNIHNVVTRDDLEAERERIRQEIQSKEDQKLLAMTHERLEEKFDRMGYPAYDRREIEERMRETQIFDPEYHYEKLYRDEILKAESTKNSTEKSSRPYTERTKSRISTDDPFSSVDALRERLKKPDATAWYLKNQEKVDRLNAQWMRGE